MSTCNWWQSQEFARFRQCTVSLYYSITLLCKLHVFSDEVKEEVTLFRGLTDFWKLDQISKKPGDIAIVGSGFLGAELAYALGERAKENKELKVTQICRETGILGAVLPRHLSGTEH